MLLNLLILPVGLNFSITLIIQFQLFFLDPEVVTSVIAEIIPVVISEVVPSPPADTLSKEDFKIIHENKISASSSYVVEPKIIKKVSNKPKIINSISERPQTAREKAKKPIEIRPDVKFSHKLGELPKYLQKRKEQSATTSKCSLAAKIDDDRPKTVDLSMIEHQKSASKAEFFVKPSKELQGDVKSEKSQVSLGLKLHKATESKSKIPLLSKEKDNESLKLECEKLKSTINEINEQLKSKMTRIKNLEAQVARQHKELKLNSELADKQLNSEAEIINLKKNVENLSGRLKIKDDAINRLKNDMEKLNNELKMQTSSFETLSMEKTHLQTLLESLKNKKKDDSKEQYSMTSEIVTMAMNEKCAENVELKQKIANLNEEIVS